MTSMVQEVEVRRAPADPRPERKMRIALTMRVARAAGKQATASSLPKDVPPIDWDMYRTQIKKRGFVDELKVRALA